MNTRILIIGADEKVIALLDMLRDIKGVILAGVCDVNKASPGMKYARQLSIPTSTNFAAFLRSKKIDIIIETSGSREFQKLLNQITDNNVKLVDSNAARLLFEIAFEKEKSKRHNQLHLISKLSNIFSAEFDTHNIVYPIFDLLKNSFRIDACAMLIFYEPKNDLIVMSNGGISEKAIQGFLDFIKKKVTAKLKRKFDLNKINVFRHKVSGQTRDISRFRSFTSIPLLTKSEKEGFIFLASTTEGALKPDDIILVKIIAADMALFIENEKIKKNFADAKMDMESMLHSMSEGVIMLDTGQQVVLANPAARILLKEEDILIGRPLFESIHNSEIIDIVKQVIDNKKSQIIEISFIKGQAYHDLRFYITQATDLLDRPSGWIVLFTDITKEKEVDKMKSEFISTTSHELRTPLATIKESIMLVLDKTAGQTSAMQDRFLEIAKKNIDRLTALINDLLDLSKIESGKIQLKKSNCSINDIVLKSLEPLKVLGHRNGLTIKAQLGDNLPQIQCDPDKITQVITNLVGNSIKFTPHGGTISIRTSKGRKYAQPQYNLPRGFIEISVQDTGVGIDKKDFDKLFTRFGQLDNSLTRRPGGSGLGLAICKELINMHGGQIWVESKPGQGSKFTFQLPA